MCPDRTGTHLPGCTAAERGVVFWVLERNSPPPRSQRVLRSMPAARPPYLTYRANLKPRARSLRRDPTPAERKLWFEFLRDLPQKFTRQKPLGRYIADFYCSARRLVIELDGDSHYIGDAQGHDSSRTASLN